MYSMKIVLMLVAGRPFFATNSQSADLYNWFSRMVRLLTTDYLIGSLVLGLLLLIALLGVSRKASQ